MMPFNSMGAPILLLIGFFAMSWAACPTIISRNEWGARRGSPRALAVNPPGHVIIHHGDTPPCKTKSQCTSRVKSFQTYHMDTKQWPDIAYNFVIGEDGNIYEGCGWGKTGTHAPKYNSKSIGICIIGDFTSVLPNSAALQAAKDLIACGVSLGKIKSDYRLVGHRQVRATSCPGNKLYEEIKTWTQWTSQP